MEMQSIRRLIEENDSIVIYRHINPDYDAVGSQLALAEILKLNYPGKQVFCYGEEMIDNPSFLMPMDNPDEEVLKRSLAILVDTSTMKRCDNESFTKCPYAIKIDHHPDLETFTNEGYVDTTASSCSQIILEMAAAFKWQLNLKAAEYLYAGIITDTVRLTISKVDSRLYADLAFLLLPLAGNEKLDIKKVNRQVYDVSLTLKLAHAYFTQKISFVEDVAYLFVSEEEIKEKGISLHDAKEMTELMNNIKGVNKYVLFTENKFHNFSASLRSHDVPINDIAMKYGGGGHPLASGISNVTKEQCLEIIAALKERKAA